MMRAALVTPSKDEFLTLFRGPHLLRGAGLSDITTFQSPILYQRGGGFFNILKGIGKRALPFIMKHVVPEALDMSKGILEDVTKGQVKLKDALRTRGTRALSGVARRAFSRGGGRGGGGGRGSHIRMKKRNQQRRRQKCYKKDVFA